MRHSSFVEEFQFTVQHPGTPDTKASYFVYPEAEPGLAHFRPSLSTTRKAFPLDYVASDGAEYVYSFVGGSSGRGRVSIESNTSFYCCSGVDITALNVSSASKTGGPDQSHLDPIQPSLPTSLSPPTQAHPAVLLTWQFSYVLAYQIFSLILSVVSKNPGCAPGWYRYGKSCYLLNLDAYLSWDLAGTECHKQRAELATIQSQDLPDFLSKIVIDADRGDSLLYVALKGDVRWAWSSGSRVDNTMWAPGAPSGRGNCGVLIRHPEERAWYWEDARCNEKNGYICQQETSECIISTTTTLSNVANGTTLVVVFIVNPLSSSISSTLQWSASLSWSSWSWSSSFS